MPNDSGSSLIGRFCYNRSGLPMSEQRIHRLEETLDRILDALKTHYAPEQVIVFGSLASGHVTETSDLDLLIVKKTDKRFYDRIRRGREDLRLRYRRGFPRLHTERAHRGCKKQPFRP